MDADASTSRSSIEGRPAEEAESGAVGRAREAIVRTLAEIYRLHYASEALFAWTLPNLVRYRERLEAVGAAARWPEEGGRINRLMRICSDRPVVARLAMLALNAAVLGQRLRILLRPCAVSQRPKSPGPPCRLFFRVGTDNERRILAWRDGIRPLPTLNQGPGTPGSLSLPTLSGPRAAALHGRLWRETSRSLRRDRIAAAFPSLRAGVTIGFLTRVEAFLATGCLLDRTSASLAVVEVMASALDERTFAAGAWARARGIPFHWVQHGFLALDLLLRVPGAMHHAYGRDYGDIARACGAARDEVANPIGSSYFPPAATSLQCRTIVVATQGDAPRRWPLGEASDVGLRAFVEEALGAGWTVIQFPHRLERSSPSIQPIAPGVAIAPKEGSLLDLLMRERPALLATAYSTAALDARAAGCLPVFVVGRKRARDYLLDDLDAYGVILDPLDRDFRTRARVLLERAAGAGGDHVSSENDSGSRRSA